MTVLDAMRDPQLFGRWFQGDSWTAWRVFLRALFGLPMSGEEARVYADCTGRKTCPSDLSEAWVISGRRGGKSLIAALVAVYLAVFKDHSKHLAPGEVATVMLIASDRRQARVLMRYVKGFLEAVPMLSRLVTSSTREGVELSNRVVIEIHTASFRAVRGYSIAAMIGDEMAFWRSEDSANPDTEILNAVRPGMATVPGSLLLCVSSPYARRGELFKAHRRYFGKDDPNVLVWKAPTLTMNPSVPGRVIREAFERDPAAASAEWDAEFRRDIEGFVSLEAVEACVVPGRRELPPVRDRRYFGFVDPSGGSRDSFTLAVAHRDGDRAVLDCLREKRPPFNPSAVVEEFAFLLKTYRLTRVEGDRYAGEWPREAFRKEGIEYGTAEKTKSEFYIEFLPALTSGRAELLDNRRLVSQLVGLERKTSRIGKDTVDHGPGGHDDLINAAAGALVLATQRPRCISGVW